MNLLVKTARSFYGISVAGIGIQQFIYLEFRPVIFPASPLWIFISAIAACIAGALLVTTGFFIAIGKKVKEISLLLAGALFVLFICFQCFYILFIQPNLPYHLGLWTDPLKELALSGGAFVMAGLSDNNAQFHRNYLLTILEKMIPAGKIFFSITMISFGIDHFLYTEFVATLVPSWFADHDFWAYFAGVALIGSGVAIIVQIRMRRIAFLLSVMLFLWVIFLHIPRAFADPYADKGNEITSVFEALVFSGIALGISLKGYNVHSRINIQLLNRKLHYEKNTQH